MLAPTTPTKPAACWPVRRVRTAQSAYRDGQRRTLADVLSLRRPRATQGVARPRRVSRGAGGHLSLAHRDGGLPQPNRRWVWPPNLTRTTCWCLPATPARTKSAVTASSTASSPKSPSTSSSITKTRSIHERHRLHPDNPASAHRRRKTRRCQRRDAASRDQRLGGELFRNF